MTTMVRSASNGKRFALQRSLRVKGIGKKKHIRIRHLEKGEEELHLKFSSKNQRNLDADFFFFPQTYPC